MSLALAGIDRAIRRCWLAPMKPDSGRACAVNERAPNGAGTMVAGLNASELAELAVLLVAVGALSGFLAGLFGIGGGAILGPVFYECFRVAGGPVQGPMA